MSPLQSSKKCRPVVVTQLACRPVVCRPLGLWSRWPYTTKPNSIWFSCFHTAIRLWQTDGRTDRIAVTHNALTCGKVCTWHGASRGFSATAEFLDTSFAGREPHRRVSWPGLTFVCNAVS